LKPERLWLTKTQTGNIVKLYESLKQKNQKRIVYSRTIKSAQATYAHRLKTYLCLHFFKVTDKALS
jgi:abortive infection bacteriophage resistance protein